MTRESCPVCQWVVQLIFVHGHYLCPACWVVVVPCCEGSERHGQLEGAAR